MKALIGKEFRENFKWVALPSLLILGPMGLMGVPSLMDADYLFYVSLVAALFAAMLGFLQVFSEARGDKRSLLLHRPMARSRIFQGKALAGLGLYALGVGIPFSCAVGLAATPGHVNEPFLWPMALPWLADLLTGVVYYFAGMLMAQREARWYGSRCLVLAAGLACSLAVWTLPAFSHALLALLIGGGLVALAAWGSFQSGGAYASQPRLSRFALAATFLLGLSALSFTGKSFLGGWFNAKSDYWNELDKRGHVLVVHHQAGNLESVTDLQGRVPHELEGKRLDRYELQENVVPWARGGTPRTQSYRNKNQFVVEYDNRSRPGGEKWWYVPGQGRLLGYDKQAHQLVGSFGPDGFSRPGEQPQGRFQGELAHFSRLYQSKAAPYLAFPGGVYLVNFRALKVQRLFAPTAGETVLWASRWENEKQRLALVFVGTDQGIRVLDEAGAPVVSAPLAEGLERYNVTCVGRLDSPERYWVWYEPAWYLGPETLETMPAFVVTLDRAGREAFPRQEVPPRPGGARKVIPHLPIVEPSSALTFFGPLTSPVEAACLLGTTRQLEAGVRKHDGAQVPLLLQFLYAGTQFFLPGERWDLGARPGLVFSYAALMMFVALLSGLACFLLARRYAFSWARRIGWALLGFACGWVGLVLMLALEEWPARIACPKCRQLRVVTRDACEHCGAAHAAPLPDGTEIFEQTAAIPRTAIAAAR
jgi:hypothetical protein